MNLDLNSLSDNLSDLLNININLGNSFTNKLIFSFLVKNFLCYNFSHCDLLILNIFNNLVKEIKILKQPYAKELFEICCNYILNTKIKSFYQLEKVEITDEIRPNNSIKMNSSNNSLNFFNNNYNLNNNNSLTKFTYPKLGYFISLILNILISFFQNYNDEKNIQKNVNPKNLNKIMMISMKNNNSESLKNYDFNPLEDSIEIFYSFLEKNLFLFSEILIENEIITKIIQANKGEFSESDFNEKYLRHFMKSEKTILNDSLNFFNKILLFKKTEKNLNNKIIFYFFDNTEKILFANDKNKNFGENKNYFLEDENLLISLLIMIIESLNNQYDSTYEDMYENISNNLNIFKNFVLYLQKGKENKFTNLDNIIFIIDKANNFISLLEEKIKQAKVNKEKINRIIENEKNK